MTIQCNGANTHKKGSQNCFQKILKKYSTGSESHEFHPSHCRRQQQQRRRRWWTCCVTRIFGARAEAIRNESVPIQLAQCSFPGLAISDAKIEIYFSNKIHGSNFSDSTGKLLWFEMTKMLIAVKKRNLSCYCNFWHTFIPYEVLLPKVVAWV